MSTGERGEVSATAEPAPVGTSVHPSALHLVKQYRSVPTVKLSFEVVFDFPSLQGVFSLRITPITDRRRAIHDGSLGCCVKWA